MQCVCRRTVANSADEDSSDARNKQLESELHELKAEVQFLRGEMKKTHKYRYEDDKQYRETKLYAVDVQEKQVCFPRMLLFGDLIGTGSCGRV
jgi:hypothetical protein